jgi:hypothetical protein
VNGIQLDCFLLSFYAGAHLLTSHRRFFFAACAVLQQAELLALAKDLVDRIVSMCKDGMRTQMPKSSDADIEKLIKKELPHILPAKTLEESRKLMAEHIYRELDIDKDGVVTRTVRLLFFAAHSFYSHHACTRHSSCVPPPSNVVAGLLTSLCCA